MLQKCVCFSFGRSANVQHVASHGGRSPRSSSCRVIYVLVYAANPSPQSACNLIFKSHQAKIFTQSATKWRRLVRLENEQHRWARAAVGQAGRQLKSWRKTAKGNDEKMLKLKLHYVDFAARAIKKWENAVSCREKKRE